MWSNNLPNAEREGAGAGSKFLRAAGAEGTAGISQCPGFSLAEVFRRQVTEFVQPTYLCITFVETQVSTSGKNQTLRAGSSGLFLERDMCGVYTVYDFHSHYALWCPLDKAPEAPFHRTVHLDAAAADAKQGTEWQPRLQWLRCMLRCSALKTDESVRYALREMQVTEDGNRAWAWCASRLKVALGVTEAIMHSSDFPMGVMVRWSKGAKLDDSSIGRDWRLMAEPFFASSTLESVGAWGGPAPKQKAPTAAAQRATLGKPNAVAAPVTFAWSPAQTSVTAMQGLNEEAGAAPASSVLHNTSAGNLDGTRSPSSFGSHTGNDDTAGPAASGSIRAAKATGKRRVE